MHVLFLFKIRNAAKLLEKRTLKTQLSRNHNFCISKYQYMYNKNMAP